MNAPVNKFSEYAKLPRVRLTNAKYFAVAKYLESITNSADYTNATLAGMATKALGFEVSDKTIHKMMFPARQKHRAEKKAEQARKLIERNRQRALAQAEREQNSCSTACKLKVLARALTALYSNLGAQVPTEVEKIAYSHE